MGRARELTQSKMCLLILTWMHLVFKATRYLTEFFLISSRDCLDPTKGNMFLSFLADESSQVTVALQYLSLLGSGGLEGSSAIRVIWEPHGFSSYLEFVQAESLLARRIRVALYCTSGALHSLFVATRKEGIERLLQLVCYWVVPRFSVILLF